ncbi:MAG TPA: tetratricopeptide repeat protein [Noviherbaspirillum sp.]|nr:tetratricopeptide repeat protein [Noviherbaspirillum sp.]
MSLINQMLQELEARHSDVGTTEPFAQQIRAVPERRRVHPAWWIALGLGVVLSGLITWLLFRAPVAEKAPDVRAQLPLRLDAELSQVSVPPQKSDPPLVQPDDQMVTAQPQSAPESPASTHESQLPPPVQPVAPPPSPVVAQPVQASSVSDGRKVAAASKPVAEMAVKQIDVAPAPVVISKQVKDFTPQQRAENEYRKALQTHQQGRTNEAITGLEQALQLDAHHAAARQTLIGLLLENKRQDDAVRLAQEGLKLDSAQPGLAMILARLQVERGELRPAIDTLERTLPHAADRADYHAFVAALLQRDERHRQAAERYLIALQKAPQNGVWWMGLGISLQAENRTKEAQDAFRRAKASNGLSPELHAFVDARLSQLQH